MMIIVIKIAKGTTKCVIKQILKLNDYKICLLNNKIILKSQQRFKIEAHNIFTEEFNKVALISYDDKRLQTFDRITSYPYGGTAVKVCKINLLDRLNVKWLILMMLLMKKNKKQNIIQSGHTFQIIHTEY